MTCATDAEYVLSRLESVMRREIKGMNPFEAVAAVANNPEIGTHDIICITVEQKIPIAILEKLQGPHITVHPRAMTDYSFLLTDSSQLL